MKKHLLLLLLSVATAASFAACKKSEHVATGGTEPSASAAPTTAASANGVELKVKWPVGTKFTYRMDLAMKMSVPVPGMPQPMRQDLNMAQTYALSVLKESPGGGRQLELEYVAQELDSMMGGQVVDSFDSKSTDEKNRNHPLRKLAGSKVRVNLDAKGEVESMEGVDELRAKLGSSSMPQLQQILQQIVSEGSVRQFVSFSQGLPNKRVAAGESWPFEFSLEAPPLSDVTIKATMKFTGNEKRENRDCTVLPYSGTISASGGSIAMFAKITVDKGTLVGTNWFDPELGAMVESISDQVIVIKAEFRGIPGMAGPNGVTMDTSHKVSLKLLEVAKVAQ